MVNIQKMDVKLEYRALSELILFHWILREHLVLFKDFLSFDCYDSFSSIFRIVFLVHRALRQRDDQFSSHFALLPKKNVKIHTESLNKLPIFFQQGEVVDLAILLVL